MLENHCALCNEFHTFSEFTLTILSKDIKLYEELNKTGPMWPEETLICFFSTRPWFRAKFWRYQTLQHSVPPQVSWHKPVYPRHFPWMECPCAPQCVRQEKSGRPCLRIYHRWVNLGSSLCQDGRSHPVDIDKPGRGNIHSRPPAKKKVIKAKDTNKKSLGCVRYREAIEVLWSSDRHWQWPWQPGGSVLWLLEPSVLSVHINHTSPFHALCNRDLPRPPMQIALTVQPTSSGWGLAPARHSCQKPHQEGWWRRLPQSRGFHVRHRCCFHPVSGKSQF